MAEWHLDGAQGKSWGSGRAENSSPKFVLQQSCCPFLVEVDFRVTAMAAFLPLHTLFSVTPPTATLLKFWNSPHYIDIYQKSQDQTGSLLLSLLYYSFQTMAGWQQTMNPGWQVRSSVNNAQIKVLSYWRLQTHVLFLGCESYFTLSQGIFAAQGELSTKSEQESCKVHEKAQDYSQKDRWYQAGSVQCPQPPLPSPRPLLNWAWTWHHDGSGWLLCSIRKTARICQQALSWINSETENKCSTENINFKRSELRAFVFVPSTIQHFFFFKFYFCS